MVQDGVRKRSFKHERLQQILLLWVLMFVDWERTMGMWVCGYAEVV
jgi:hypothetical protein